MQTSVLPTVLAALEQAAEVGGEAGLTFVDDLVDAGSHWSYPRLRSRAREIAVALSSGYGVRKGERVALALTSPEEFVLTFFGVLYAGAVRVPTVDAAAPREDHVETVRQAALIDDDLAGWHGGALSGRDQLR